MRGLIDRLARTLALPVVPGARTRLGELPMIAWFSAITWFAIGRDALNVEFGWDAILYTHAARALLAGGDPWAPAGIAGQYAGPPPGLLPYLPFVGLPDSIVAVAWMAIAAISAVYVLRRLRLPAWWLLFPPVSVGIFAGSTALPVTALLVAGGPLADGAAVALRAYAALPLALLGRWRGLVAAAAIVLVTAPFLAWPTYFADSKMISELLVTQTQGGQSAAAVPPLVPIAIVCLFLLGRRRAAWLLVPALWPFSQGYYGVIALPVLAEVPLVALAMATNNLPIIIPGLIVVGLVAQVIAERLRSPLPSLAELGWRTLSWRP